MCILLETITLTPILSKALQSTQMGNERRYSFSLSLKRVEDINLLLSSLIRGTSLADHKVTPIPSVSGIWKRHIWGSFMSSLFPLWVHGIATLLLPWVRHPSQLLFLYFAKLNFHLVQTLFFPAASSLIWALSVPWITSIPLASCSCSCLYSYPTACLPFHSRPFFRC